MFRFLCFVMLALAAQTARAETGAPASTPTLMVLGDSLSAAYGIPATQGWVTLLEQRLKARGYPHQVINASISGETTAGGLRRLPRLLDRYKPEIVLIELGANDGLRGLPLARLQESLVEMATLSRKAGATPVLFEMRIPSNYGPAYTEDFRKVFATAATQLKAPLVPFFLESFALDPDAFLDDGIHPAAVAQPKMLDAVWPTLEPLLKPAATKKAS